MAKKRSTRTRSATRKKRLGPIRSQARTKTVRPARRKRTATKAAHTKARAEQKGFGSPDEVRTFDKGELAVLKIGGGVVGRLTLEPGWHWSQHVKPVAGTNWCEVPHFQYLVSGRLHVAMADGTEFEIGPEEVSALPPGHDAWVVGPDPVVLIDWSGASNYAKK